MEIINNTGKQTEQFVNLPIGTVFITHGDICIKIERDIGNYNTVRLSDGRAFSADNKTPCTVVKATLTIE